MRLNVERTKEQQLEEQRVKAERTKALMAELESSNKIAI
jgi:hypothetical protein